MTRINEPQVQKPNQTFPTGIKPSILRWDGLAVMVFGLALAIRVVYALFLSDHPSFLTPIFDAQGYHARANTWIRGQGLSPEIFDFSILYHLLLSALYFVTDASVPFARGVQLVLGSLACALLAAWTRNVFGRTAGLVTGVMASLYGPAIILSAELMPTTLEVLWLVGLLMLLQGNRLQRPAGWLILGVMGAFGYLLGVSFALIWLLVSAPALIRAARPWNPATVRRTLLPGGGALFLTLFITALLVNGAFRSDLRFNKWAQDFYLGNSRDLCQTLTLRPGPDFTYFMDSARAEMPEGDSESGRYFAGKALRQIVEHPGQAVRNLGIKSLHLLCSREIPGSLDIRALRDVSPISQLLLWQAGPVGFPFGLILALTVIGLISRTTRTPRELAVMLVILAAGLVLMRVTAPERLDFAMLLLPLAGLGLLALPEVWHQRNWPRASLLLGAGGAALALSCLPGPFCVEQAVGKAEVYSALGHAALRTYNMEKAAYNFESALAQNPADAQAWNGLGICRRSAKRTVEALDCFRKATELNPNFAMAYFNQASLEAERKRDPEAIALFERGLQLQPYNGQAHNDLGSIYLRNGNPAMARDHFAKAKHGNPTVVEVRLNLAEALQQLGLYTQALEEARTAIPMDPSNARGHLLLGFALLRSDRRTEAEGSFFTAQKLNPKSADAQFGQAALLAYQGRWPEAHARYTNALARDPSGEFRLLNQRERELLHQAPPTQP